MEIETANTLIGAWALLGTIFVILSLLFLIVVGMKSNKKG